MDTEFLIRWFKTLNKDDVDIVGGKNASLGEMINKLGEADIPIPAGFATTAEAFWLFIDHNKLQNPIRTVLEELCLEKVTLAAAGSRIRSLILAGSIPDELQQAIVDAYRKLCYRYESAAVDVAVRSSATAEDLPEASFAGQHESFLNISGEQRLLDSCRTCFASLFTDRAIAYRTAHGFDHMKVALSVGVQKMVRSDRACAGVMFTLDTETGFPDVVLINAAWGLGESVVKGTVTPDQFSVFKPALKQPELVPIIGKQRGPKKSMIVYASAPDTSDEVAIETWDDDGGREPDEIELHQQAVASGKQTVSVRTTTEEQEAFVLTDDEILELAQWARQIEEHYGYAMDIEWAKDGDTGKLFIVQARPETVQTNLEATALKTYRLESPGRRLVKGQSVGDAIAAGSVCRLDDISEIESFVDGSILVARNTDPDWVPVMKRAIGIVTDSGGRTSHAAIVSRELGVPAIVGTGNATAMLRTGQSITISCAEGDEGYVYDGILPYETKEISLEDVPKTETDILINIANPSAALRWWRLPCDGIGLARMEYIINNVIKIHPMALVDFDAVKDEEAREAIKNLTKGYSHKPDYFVDTLARGIATIAASRYPDPVIVRMSDFKTNEYAHLIGGTAFEPAEENPMLGWRGASRYYSDEYRRGFELECKAIMKVRNHMGLHNVVVMIPFCRTLEEADRVIEELASNGIRRGENGLEIYVM
ncbi:MAG: phosphoenolpyruvate synthase, partial [Rhodothermales bacterium]|nr:phosphoenolpyruvate synthase [Rhodothermales bacterium]